MILLQFSYAGGIEAGAAHVRPFSDIHPVSDRRNSSVPPNKIQEAAEQDMDSPICQRGTPSLSKILFPLGLKAYNITANRAVYKLFEQLVKEHPEFNRSIVQFESYALQGMKAIDPASTAYPHRNDNALV